MGSSSGKELELVKSNVHGSALRDPVRFTLVVVHTDSKYHLYVLHVHVLYVYVLYVHWL
jgi:hypothetical protein